MTQQAFVELVRSHGRATAQCEALPAALDRVLLAGGPSEGDPALWRRRRMNAFLAGQDHVLSLMLEDLAVADSECRDDRADLHGDPRVQDLEPLALAHHRVRLVSLGTAHWLTRLDEFRHEHEGRVRRRDYDDALCGAPPFRDADHGELKVLSVDDWSLPDRRGRRRPRSAVAPFLDADATSACLAALYLDRLLVRTLGEADLKCPQEEPLLGQRGLFARLPIAAGTCLGVYSGQLMDEVDQFILRDDRYLMALRSAPTGDPTATTPRRAAINGEGPLAMMNTLFDYDAAGQPTGHPGGGYNVERVLYPARLSHGWHVGIPAAFTCADVQAEEELRFNYELAPTS
jgi:hypothetical protein